MKDPNNRRKLRLIDKEYQLGQAWRQVLAFIVLLFAGVAMMLLPSLIQIHYSSMGLSMAPVAQEYLILNQRVWPAVLFIIAGLFVYTALSSHKVAGPIYRINKTLQDMLDGNDPPGVRLRKGDYLQDTAQLLDQLIQQRAEERRHACQGTCEACTPEQEQVEELVGV